MFTKTNTPIIIETTSPYSLVWGNTAKEKIKVLVHNTKKTNEEYIVYNYYTFKVSELKRFLGIN